ncbi:MAG: MarR family transcriptional regulator, partial [Cyanobacteria bacterium P01_G01_bin.49]
MRREIEIVIEKVKSWFPKTTAKIEAQANELETKLKETSSHNPLPQKTLKHLRQKIKALPSSAIYQATVEAKLTKALAKWQAEDNVPNTLVVLGNPVEPIELILQQTLTTWQGSNQMMVKSLTWSARPHDYTSISTQLQEVINLSQNNPEQKSPLLFIIPNISWCFLRCVDGLDTIDYLQHSVFQDRSRFWLIGCNNWAWQYLDRVC